MMRIAPAMVLLLLVACAAAPAPSLTPAPLPATFAAVQAPQTTAQLSLFDAAGRPLAGVADLVSGAPCFLDRATLIYTTMDPSTSASSLAVWQAGVATPLTTTTVAALSDPACGPTLDATLVLRSPYALVDDEPAPPELWRWQDATLAPLGATGPALNALYSPSEQWLTYELFDPPSLVVQPLPTGPATILPYAGTSDWLADGATLVVARRASGPNSRFPELVLHAVPTGSETVILNDPAADVYFPRAAPADGRLVFVRRQLGAAQGELWLLPDVRSSPPTPQQLTADPGYDNFDMRWSPDGTRLMWSRVELATQVYSIWQMDLAGGQPQQLVLDAWWGRWVPPAE